MEKVLKMSSVEHIQPFKNKTNDFLKNATEKVEKENKKLSKSRKEFLKMLKFYKFIPKCGSRNDCKPNNFFDLWTAFVFDFKTIWNLEINLKK